MLALRTGEPVRDVVMGVYRPDEELVWISINAEPLRNDQGRVVMVVCSFSDITHRKELEDRLRQAQKMEVIGQLAGGVAHDFNNILATMMLNLEMLRMEQGLPAAAEGPLAEFENAARRGANLTQQLLSFSRQQAMQPVLMDVNKALANLVLMLSRLLGEHIHIDLISNSSELWVEADAAMLDQVVMNLCVNARDAMPRGGTLTIEAAAADVGVEEARKAHDGRPGRFVRIQVQDTGTGMEPSVLTHLFEPFFTTKEVGKGTGLGLASVHGIIHQHKGWVAVESSLGVGSTFKVYLPRAAKPGTPAAPPAVQLVREGANEMVLLVEDEAALRRVSQKMLVRLGYRVLAAGDGPEAMRIWSTHAGEVDLLLTDMMMPGGMTGLDLAGKLRGERPGLKVIIMSGYSAQIVGSGSLRNAGVDFLPKPYHLEALSVALRQALAPGPTTS